MKTKHLLIKVVLLAALLLASCVSSDDVRVGELRTESQSVELGDAKPVRVKVVLGAGDLAVAGGAKKLLVAAMIVLPALVIWGVVSVVRRVRRRRTANQ